MWSDEPLKPGEVICWSGGRADGRLSGKGVLEVTAPGQRQLRFERTMRGGKADGEGVLESRDQDGDFRYTGEFADSLFDGYGVLELADGSRYQGGSRPISRTGTVFLPRRGREPLSGRPSRGSAAG